MSKRNALMEDSVSLHISTEDETTTLQLKSDEDVVASVELLAGSGVGGIRLATVEGMTVEVGDECVKLKWGDPSDVVLEGVTLAEWGRTVVVRKEGEMPTNTSDGTVIETITQRNKYASSYLVDNTVTNGTTYYYGVFPVSKGGTPNLETREPATPHVVMPAAATNLSVQTAQGSAKVTYTRPEGITRADLVYKKGSIPSSSSDGTKISNYASGTNITGLEDEATYYFIVYTYNKNVNDVEREMASASISGVIKAVVELPEQVGTLVYNGSSQSPTWNSDYDALKLEITGSTEGTNATSYTVTFTPRDGYIWEDGTNTGKQQTWHIERASISAVPTQINAVEYTGSEITAEWDGFDSSKMSVTGDKATNAGNHTAIFTPDSNHKWAADNSTTGKQQTWVINRQTIANAPYQTSVPQYSGSAITPAWTNYDSTKMDISGDTSKTTVGTYTATFTPKNNYRWSDGTITGKDVNWSIAKKKLTAPTVTNTSKTYNGSAQSPTITGFDSATMNKTGDSATDANNYSVSITLKDTNNYEWSDGTITAKTTAWSISATPGSLTLSATSVEIKKSVSTTATVNVTRSGLGKVTVSTSNAAVATAAVTNDTGASPVITITGVGKGTATITVSVAASTNYTAPANQTISVTVKTLEIVNFPNATLDQIGQMIDGAYNDEVDLSTVWSVGQEVEVQLTASNSGTAAHVAQKMKLVVLGFNHDDLKTAINGKTKAVVTLGVKYILGNGGSAEYEYYWGSSHYPVGDSENYSQSPLRTWLNGGFKNSLPEAIRSKIKTVVKKNFSTHLKSNMGTVNTEDDCFLLSYPEVFGTATYTYYKEGSAVGSYEGTQYKYFETAANRTKYPNNNGSQGSSAYLWWLRSPSSYYNSGYGYCWCGVAGYGSANGNNGNNTYGLAPAFCL